MAESSPPGLGDLMNMFGGTNPFAAIVKTIDQFKRGVNDFLTAVENFNKAMETINGIATRANALFDDVEEPIRAFMPQVTRSIKAVDAVVIQISGPIEKVAPGISRLADTLSNPVFTTMPTDLAGFLDTLGDVAHRLQPLAQMAENAGNMFGLRPFASLLGGSSPVAPQPFAATQPPPPPPPPAAAAKAAPTKRAPQKKAAPVRAAPTKRAPQKKAAPVRAASTKRAPQKKAAPVRATATKVPRAKAAPRKTASGTPVRKRSTG